MDYPQSKSKSLTNRHYVPELYDSSSGIGERVRRMRFRRIRKVLSFFFGVRGGLGDLRSPGFLFRNFCTPYLAIFCANFLAHFPVSFLSRTLEEVETSISRPKVLPCTTPLRAQEQVLSMCLRRAFPCVERVGRYREQPKTQFTARRQYKHIKECTY